MPGASVAADRDIKSLRRALMHWITAWLGALKGPWSSLGTRQAWLPRAPDESR